MVNVANGPEQFQTRPLDEWFCDTVRGDIMLCDPFTGDPLTPHIQMAPKTPPSAFMHSRLGDGYGMWQSFRYGRARPAVTVYMTDPVSPDGLGDLDKLYGVMEDVDIVVHSEVQAVRAEEVRRLANPVGRIALGGVEHKATYRSTLEDMAQSAGKNMVNLAPEIDPLTGGLDEGGLALQAVRDAVVGQGLDQKDPNDPDATYLATDLVYANTVQWHHLMKAGLEIERWRTAHNGLVPASMLMIAPIEHVDIARKLVESGLPGENIIPGAAHDEFFDDSLYIPYARVLDAGFIDKAWHEGAEY
jgi:hypothetical protein